MIKYIKELNNTINEFYNSIVLLKEKTLEHNDILRKIDKVLPKENVLCSSSNYATISGTFTLNEEQVITILDNKLTKDYFTKEFLNQEATTTKKLYVVNGDKISIEYYKENCCAKDGERWFEFNGQEYYFNK